MIDMNMMSSPARPMDLDDTEYYPHGSHRPSIEDHHTPLTKLIFTSEHHHHQHHQQHLHQTPPLFRIVQNPFDPPTSAHLKQRLASPSIFRVLSQNEENERVNLINECLNYH